MSDSAGRHLPGIGTPAKVPALHVEATIKHVPTLALRCECGSETATNDVRWIEAARAGKELPPVACAGCGRQLIGKERRIQVGRGPLVVAQ